MKITKLHLENFRVHGDSTLSFGDNSFIVIRGRNFAGKTTVGQAISMALTPSTTGLDAQGRGYIRKIKRGTSKAVITADLQTKHHLIQRTVVLNSNASGRTQKTVCLNDPNLKTAKFDQKLEQQKAALTVALNTDAFLRMDEKEQKNLLAGLALPSHYDFDAKVISAVDMVLEPGAINFQGEPFATINLAYKKLFDERQVVNRQVKEFVIPEALPVPEGVDSASVQQQLAEWQAKRRERQQERDQAVAEANKEEVARAKAKAKLQEAIESGSRHEKAIQEKLLKEGQLAYLRKTAEGKDELEKFRTEYRQTSIYRDNLASQLKNLEAVPFNAKACPTCDQPVTPEKLKALTEKMKEGLRQVNISLALLEQKIKALGDVDNALDLLAKHDAALKELDSFDEQAAERWRKIEQAEKNLPEPTLFDFAPYNVSISECEIEIERLSGLLRPVIVAEERRKEVQIKQGQLAALKEKATVLDGLVKYFDKGGIKAKLIGEYIGGFEHKLNEVMGAWEYSCSLSIEPVYSFEVTNARGDVNPVSELSGAERVMFSLAFQCAVSMTANIGMVVVDEIAMFLPELRPILYRKLFGMVTEGYLEQVILLVADTSDQVPKLPGSAFFLVTDGAVIKQGETKFIQKETANERRPERSIA